MGITALYAQGETGIKVRFQFIDHSDPTDSSRIAEVISKDLFRAVNWADDKRFDIVKSNRGKYYSWTYSWTETEDNKNTKTFRGTITQTHGGNKTYFYINLPQGYESDDRDVVLTKLMRLLRI